MQIAGGILALVKDTCPVAVVGFEEPADGLLFLQFSQGCIGPALGGVYIPSASDPRFRSRQSNNLPHHFNLLSDALDRLPASSWLVGGDFNA
eukprot:5270725-Karenia_brevis.AAC.1